MKKNAELLQQLLAEMKIVDLTVPLGPEYPTSPIWGVPFIKAPFNYFTSPQTDMRGPYMDYVLIFEEHSGTHFDSPSHGIPNPDTKLPNALEIGRETTDKVPLEKFMGPCCVIDCTDLEGTAGPGLSPVITVEKIKKWEAKNGFLNKDDIVLLYTGWTDKFYKEFPVGYMLDRECKLYKKTEGWPAPDTQAMQYLASKEVKHVGIDCVSMGLIQDDSGPHHAGLSKGIVFTEKLCNLGLIPARGAYFIFLPIKVEGGSAAPGRAIAII